MSVEDEAFADSAISSQKIITFAEGGKSATPHVSQTQTPRHPRDVHSTDSIAPSTPHNLRALQQRHAANAIAGRKRRRSGQLERESPRDALRNLSRSMLMLLTPLA